MDSVPIRIPQLHFGKVQRGKLDKGTKFFVPTGYPKFYLDTLDMLCSKLTRKICASKAASIFDLRCLLAPVLTGTESLMRDTIKSTEDWDEVLS